MRILEIRPAILATNNAILTKAEKIAAMANRKNEQLDWEVASYLDSEEGWHAFLKDHEDSDSAKYARRNIKRARAEAEAARRPIPDDATRRQWQVAADKVVTTMLPGTTFKDCPDCPMMVIIPAGNYQMGEKWLTRFYGDLGSSGEGPKENITSEPVHVVTFALPFAMGQTEVTNAQWRSIMGTEPLGSIALDEKCDDECPVSSASWTDVQKFIVRLNAKTGKSYRLPSEAEWEYSCRAGKREKYCGSNNLDEVAWHSGNSQKRNAVAVKKANAFGLYDMSGSVMEWVQDCTNSSYDGAPSDGSAWQAGDYEMRMARGGASNFGASELNPAIRHPLSNSGWPVVGFRLARSLR